MDKQQSGPRNIEVPSIVRAEIGYISVAERCSGFPFEINRTFWINNVPEYVTRGRHAHHELEQVLISMAGIINVKTDDSRGREKDFILNQPDQGLYLPPLCWHTMQFSHTSVLLSLASKEYREDDYIRSYQQFNEIRNKQS